MRYNSIIKRCGQDERGATVIEFALIAPLLFLLVFAIIEFSLIMYATGVLENATAAAARYGVTGNSYDVAPSEDECNSARGEFIRKSINDFSMGLLDPDDIEVTTEIFSDFTTVEPTGESDTASYGCGGEVVLYNVSYDWQLMTPLVKTFFPDGIYTIRSKALVKNERFS